MNVDWWKWLRRIPLDVVVALDEALPVPHRSTRPAHNRAKRLESPSPVALDTRSGAGLIAKMDSRVFLQQADQVVITRLPCSWDLRLSVVNDDSVVGD